jgi:hypothetical protein
MTHNSLQLKKLTYIFLTLLIIIPLLNSCKKEDDKKDEEDTTPVVAGSVILNGVYTSFSRGYFYVSDASGYWTNFVTLYRLDNSEVRIIFREFGEGRRVVAPGDSTVIIKYKDSGQRIYTADSGAVDITSYKMRDGVIRITGGFAFRGKTNPSTLPDGSEYFVTMEAEDGAFINLESSDE